MHMFPMEDQTSPVVKRSCGLDRVKDDAAVVGCEARGREVEAGEDWVR